MKTDSEVILYRQKDAWLSIIICYLVQIIISSFLIPLLHKIFPSFSQIILYFCLPVFSALIAIIYLVFEYGRIRLPDLLPRGSDYFVLLIAIFVLFVRFSFAALHSPFRTNNQLGQIISRLSSSEYFLVLLTLIIIGPLLEEVLLRKYVFEIFKNKYSILLAITLTAFSDTLLHFDFERSVVELVKIFLYGVFFTLVYFKSRLGVSFLIHSLTNFLIYFIWWR